MTFLEEMLGSEKAAQVREHQRTTMSRALTAEVMKVSYSVEINKPQFLQLIKQDVDWQIDFDGDLTLNGAMDIEYNGHFGNYIYFAVVAGEGLEQSVQSILKIIDNALNHME